MSPKPKTVKRTIMGGLALLIAAIVSGNIFTRRIKNATFPQSNYINISQRNGEISPEFIDRNGHERYTKFVFNTFSTNAVELESDVYRAAQLGLEIVSRRNPYDFKIGDNYLIIPESKPNEVAVDLLAKVMSGYGLLDEKRISEVQLASLIEWIKQQGDLPIDIAVIDNPSSDDLFTLRGKNSTLYAIGEVINDRLGIIYAFDYFAPDFNPLTDVSDAWDISKPHLYYLIDQRKIDRSIILPFLYKETGEENGKPMYRAFLATYDGKWSCLEKPVVELVEEFERGELTQAALFDMGVQFSPECYVYPPGLFGYGVKEGEESVKSGEPSYEDIELSSTSRYSIHRVKHGDTLFSIARTYGTTVDEIVRINNIPNKDLIEVDQELLIP